MGFVDLTLLSPCREESPEGAACVLGLRCVWLLNQVHYERPPLLLTSQHPPVQSGQWINTQEASANAHTQKQSYRWPITSVPPLMEPQQNIAVLWCSFSCSPTRRNISHREVTRRGSEGKLHPITAGLCFSQQRATIWMTVEIISLNVSWRA